MPDRQLKTPQECQEEAERCRRMADEAILSETREVMLRLAARWQALAAQDDAKPAVAP